MFQVNKKLLQSLTSCENEDEIGQFKEVKHVVPQGKMLGPVRFNIHINDLFDLPSVNDREFR